MVLFYGNVDCYYIHCTRVELVFIRPRAIKLRDGVVSLSQLSLIQRAVSHKDGDV